MAATKTSKRFQNRRNQIMNSAKTAHCKVVNFADELIEGTVATGTKYQKVAAKAIRKSEPLIEKQIDIVFDSLEMFTEQFQNNSKRLQKLLGITKAVDNTTMKINQTVKMVSEKLEDGFEDASKTLKSTFNQGKAKSDKLAKSVKVEGKKAVKTTRKKVKAATSKKTSSRAKATKK